MKARIYYTQFAVSRPACYSPERVSARPFYIAMPLAFLGITIMYHLALPFTLLFAALSTSPITIDASVVVQIEVGIIFAVASLILRGLYKVNGRLTTIEAMLEGPKGGAGLVSTVAGLESEISATGIQRIRTVADYVTWRRRVEVVLKKNDPSFELTPDHLLLDLLCGEDSK
jgi:hypothetical protein